MTTYLIIGAALLAIIVLGGFLIWLAFRNVTASADKAGTATEDSAINKAAAEKADAIAQAAAVRPSDDDVTDRLRKSSF